MPLVSLDQAAKLIANVKVGLLTSHDIVDRIKYPKFYGSQPVPAKLVYFKEKLTIYRQQTSELIVRLDKYPQLKMDLPTSDGWNDFSDGSFVHQLLLHLVLASFGIGECGECCVKLMIELSKTGADFAMVGMCFPGAGEGSEVYHTLVIVNLPKMPSLPAGVMMTLPLLLAHLPREAIIVDPFLELCFKPNQMPKKLQQYLAAYGRTTVINSFRHLFNMSTTFFDRYLLLADKIRSTLIAEVDLPGLDKLPLKNPKGDAKKVTERVTFPVCSPHADRYLSDLDTILGKTPSGEKIVKKDATSATVSFPSFWLRQLDKPAIQELSEQLSVTSDQLCPK